VIYAREPPEPESIASVLHRIDALIGLGSKYPARRSPIEADDRDKERYHRLWQEVDAELNNVSAVGFPIANPNLLSDIESMWAWCIGFGGSLSALRGKPRELYAGTIEQLKQIKELLSSADAPLELQREFRESALRRNELFIVMAFRAETQQFRAIAKSAASAVA